MWLNKAIQRFKIHKRKPSPTPYDLILREKEKIQSESQHHNQQQHEIDKKESELSNQKINQPRLNSSIDPLLNIDNDDNNDNIIEPIRSRTKTISPIRSRRSSSLSPVFRNSFDDEEINNVGLHRISRSGSISRSISGSISRSISNGSITSQERPNLIRRQSSLEIMRDLANEEREMASINLSQSLPEGFKVDERNW